MKKYIALLGFVVLVLGVGTLVGLMTLPGEWYAGLQKPFFNPPPWIFAPVWSVLYILIAVAGWLVWSKDPKSPAMWLWVVQLALNFLWTPVFFALHRPGLAVVVIVALLAAILAFMAQARRLDRVAAWLFLPYALWVAFATLLNTAIWWLN